MSKILEEVEILLFSDAEPYTPEGSQPIAVVHQWINAIAYDLPLFGKAVDKATIIKKLMSAKLYHSKLGFQKLLTESLPIQPPSKPKFTFIDLFAGIGGMRIGAQNNGGVCVFSSE